MGRLGNGSQSDALVPSAVQGLASGVDDIAAGGIVQLCDRGRRGEVLGQQRQGQSRHR